MKKPPNGPKTSVVAELSADPTLDEVAQLWIELVERSPNDKEAEAFLRMYGPWAIELLNRQPHH